jgi:hypothetical protein
MDNWCSKLVRFSKPQKVSDKNKNTLAYYATELITAVTTFIVQTPAEYNVTRHNNIQHYDTQHNN